VDNSINVLYDHYKDTCSVQRKNLKVRNILFVVVIVVLGLLLLISYCPDTVGDAILSFLVHEYGINVRIQFGIMQSLIWVVLLYISVRYYQSTINIERTYKYIHKLEERLSFLVSNNDEERITIVIDRESGNYLEDYPVLSSIIDSMYKWVFPIIYIIAVAFKIIIERRCEFLYAFDIILFTIAIVLCVLYIFLTGKSSKNITRKLIRDDIYDGIFLIWNVFFH